MAKKNYKTDAETELELWRDIANELRQKFGPHCIVHNIEIKDGYVTVEVQPVSEELNRYMEYLTGDRFWGLKEQMRVTQEREKKKKWVRF